MSVLVNADMQSEGQPETMKTQASNIKLEDLFEGIKASLLKVIEWSKRIPAFGSLSLDDQVKLLKSSWCEHCTLKLAAQNGPKSDTVLLANGLSCSKDNIEDPEVRRVLFRIFGELAYWLDYLNVDRVELACLKGVLLFNPGEYNNRQMDTFVNTSHVQRGVGDRSWCLIIIISESPEILLKFHYDLQKTSIASSFIMCF